MVEKNMNEGRKKRNEGKNGDGMITIGSGRLVIAGGWHLRRRGGEREKREDTCSMRF